MLVNVIKEIKRERKGNIYKMSIKNARTISFCFVKDLLLFWLFYFFVIQAGKLETCRRLVSRAIAAASSSVVVVEGEIGRAHV